MTTSINNTTQPVNFIRFHGLTLLVVENGGVEYTEARPLCDLAGMLWSSARRTLLAADNAVLYGTKTLTPPQIGGSRGTSTPQKDHEWSENGGVVHIRLDRARIFLARINTSHMKAKGNVAAAEELLNLQIEWAEETKGDADRRLSPGLGINLIKAIVERQLGGTVYFAWSSEGLAVKIALPWSIEEVGRLLH